MNYRSSLVVQSRLRQRLEQREVRAGQLAGREKETYLSLSMRSSSCPYASSHFLLSGAVAMMQNVRLVFSHFGEITTSCARTRDSEFVKGRKPQPRLSDC